MKMRRTTATLLVLVSATAFGAEGARSSPSASAPPAGTKYVSKRYGYEMVLRGKYTMIQALFQWDGAFPFGDSGKVDLILDPKDRKFIVAAKPVSRSMSLSHWEAFVVGVKRQACDRLRDFRSTSLGGVPAREFVNRCPGYDVITLAALHRRRGYLLEYVSPTNFSAATDHRTYEAGRRAFRFTQT
jgi:hypothetical protein